MTETFQQNGNRYALVNSLYGPGAITCWYLTILAVLLSWVLHPRKRKSGSIDVDLVVVLTLPTVAAGHLIYQLLRFPSQGYTGSQDIDSGILWKRVQDVAAIEAPFNVVETFMSISVVLFLVAAWSFCIARAITVGLVGLLCFAVECYIYFSRFMDLGINYEPGMSEQIYPAFSRYFVANFTALIIAIIVILTLCGLISGGIAWLLLRTQSTASSQPQRTSNDTVIDGQSDRRAQKASRSITWITSLFLPISFIMSAVPVALHTSFYGLGGEKLFSWQAMAQNLGRIGKDFFPRTATSFTDLDQAVAAATGATVLSFSIYSIASTHVAIWKTKKVSNAFQSEDSSIDVFNRS